MKLLSAALMLVTLVGCGSVAEITMRDNFRVDGEIVGSTDRAIFVETDEGEEQVARQEIRDIDHPGSVAATIGGILMVYGALNIATGYPQCAEKGAAFCIGVMTPEAVGLLLFSYGWRVWRASVIAARPPKTKHSKLQMRLAPMILMAGHSRTGSLQLAAEFRPENPGLRGLCLDWNPTTVEQDRRLEVQLDQDARHGACATGGDGDRQSGGVSDSQAGTPGRQDLHAHGLVAKIPHSRRWRVFLDGEDRGETRFSDRAERDWPVSSRRRESGLW